MPSTQSPVRGFASDNQSGMQPEILAALAAANVGHASAYGGDPWTARAVARFRELFGPDASVYFVFNGTAANVLALEALRARHQAVICAETAHIHVDECGAPERYTGSKLLTVPTPDGKLTPELAARAYRGIGVPHHVQPAVVSVSQPTEYGTLYTPAELRALADWAHARGMRLHVDGARIANAVAALGVSARELIVETGVDALSFGGTKNGLMLGEAVVLLRPELARDFEWVRKQGMQLASKMRFVAAQFDALLEDGRWLRSAAHANAMARRLEAAVRGLPGLEITQPVQANGVFARLPRAAIAKLQAETAFYVWDEARDEVRWMASFDTTPEDVDAFAARVRAVLTGNPSIG